MTANCCRRIALFPGSFDPFTRGHESIVNKALSLFDEIVIAIGCNSTKRSLFSLEERVAMIEELYAQESRVRVVSYSGLTIDAARECGAQFMLRGVRSVVDFEYEKSLADINREISGVETIVLFTEPIYAHVSSSVVRELLHYGHDVSQLIPSRMVLPERE